MRWWLAFAFAAVAALAAVVVAEVLAHRAASAFHDRAQEVVVGSSVGAAEAISRHPHHLRQTVREVALRRKLALFVVDGGGTLRSAPVSGGVAFESVPQRRRAIAAGLRNQRFVASLSGGSATVVALPLDDFRGGVLLSYERRTGVPAEVAIVRREIITSALWAAAAGAAAGLLIATVITQRLRRIADAAAAIARGDFDVRVGSAFSDELGSLALTVDRMRMRLRESFSELARERDRLQRVLERLHDGVVTVDDDLRVEFANSSAARMLGGAPLPEGAPLPDPWPGLSLPDLVRRLHGAEAATAEARVQADGEHVYTVVGIPSATSAVLVISDVSERDRRERAEREFVANAAHELRTPMAAISSAVEVLQAGAKDDPAARDRFLGHIEREAARLGRLARAMLVLARAQTGREALQLSPVELAPVLADALETVEPAGGVRLDVDCPPGLAALAQADLAYQVFSNLAANAVKHTRDGTIAVVARADGDRVAVTFADTGTGIPSADRDRIFDRFYRGGSRGRDGFGLGLAIVREVVGAFGGGVDVRSDGDGTTIRVDLQRAAV